MEQEGLSDMSLRENRIIDGEIKVYDKVQVSIDRLKAFEPPEGYWLAFSGGKDSVALKGVADLSGVKYEAHYSLTNVDPPELVQFIKTFPDVIIDRPEKTMWQLIVERRMPPTRVVRYCCQELKESSGEGRVTLTGVRWAESVKRKNNRNLVDIGSSARHKITLNNDNDESRRTVENCYRKRKTIINPIIDWSDEEVWQFIKEQNLQYCKLYDEGWKRLGCIGCPLAGGEMMKKEFKCWSKYEQMYIKAFQRMIDKRKEDGLPTEWNTGQECFDWWVGNDKKDKAFDGQIKIRGE